MFTNLPTGSVPLYGAKPPDVSQFKRKMRTMEKARIKLTEKLEKISFFLSDISPQLSQSNNKTNGFIFSMDFILKLNSKLVTDDPNPEPQIEKNDELELDLKSNDQAEDQNNLGSLENIDKPETEVQEPKPNQEEENLELDNNINAQNEETEPKQEELEKPIQEDSNNPETTSQGQTAHEHQPEHARTDSLPSFDHQSAPTRVNDHDHVLNDNDDRSYPAGSEIGKGSMPGSAIHIDDPKYPVSQTQDYIYANEREFLDSEMNVDSQGYLSYQLSQSLQQTSPKQGPMSEILHHKTKSIKSEEDDVRTDSHKSNEKRKLQKILDPLPYDEETNRRKKIVSETESSESYRMAEYSPQGIYKDEFRKMMKAKANYDVTSSFFPIKTELKAPRRPVVEQKIKSVESSGRKIKKSVTSQLKTLDGLPIILEQNNMIPSMFPETAKTYESGTKKIQSIQLPSIDSKGLIRVPVKKPPKTLITSQSLSINNLGFFSQTPQTGSVRVLTFGDNITLAKKVYSEKPKPAQSMVLEKNQLLNSPQRLELNTQKSPKILKPTIPGLEHQFKLEPLKNIKIRKIANPNAIKKNGV